MSILNPKKVHSPKREIKESQGGILPNYEWSSRTDKEEFEKAWVRVFGCSWEDPGWDDVDKAGGLMRWWLRFVQDDHERRGSGGWLELGAEALVFCAYPRLISPITIPDKATLKALIAEGIDLAAKIAAKDNIRVTIAPLDIMAVQFPNHCELPRWSSEYRSVYVFQILYILHLLRLSPIRRCNGCNIIFYAARKDQEFHDANCFARVTMREKRGTPQERYGKQGRPPKEKPQKETR